MTNLKNKGFYWALLIIYLLFISKDTILSIFNTSNKELYQNPTYYEEEYHKLSELVDLENTQSKIIYTQVLLRDIYEFYDTITINKGTKNNVKVGDPIINSKGLIGLIKETHKNYSKVALLTNNKTNLSVKINNSYGILTSIDGQLVVKNLKLGNSLAVGDAIYTSGLTEVKEGILVGTVKEINTDNLELEYQIKVEAVSDFQDLKYLGVIIS